MKSLSYPYDTAFDDYTIVSMWLSLLEGCISRAENEAVVLYLRQVFSDTKILQARYFKPEISSLAFNGMPETNSMPPLIPFLENLKAYKKAYKKNLENNSIEQ